MVKPTLPPLEVEPSGRHLQTATLNGIRSGLYDPLRLVEPTRDIYDDAYVVDNDVDLSKENAAFRKALELKERHKGFMKTLNAELRGGPSYPILGAILGEIPLAGTTLTMLTTAISVMKDAMSVQARLGDELWILEKIGMSGSQPVHVEQVWLVDPYRLKHGTSGRRRAVWVLHEERTDVNLS